jgi:hypothetical protein
MPLDRADFKDAPFLDEEELSADGSTDYRSGDSVTSTTSGTKTVEMAGGGQLLLHSDDPVESGDTFVLSGSTAADGSYTVDTVVDDDTFTVVEAIVDSTGGTAAFQHPSGASRIGVDPSSISSSTATNAQQVLEDIDAAVSGGGLTAAAHKALRQLIHFVDDGPGSGFTSGAYKETEAVVFPTYEIWWESSSKLKKIVSLDTTWTGILITTEVWKVYDTDGSTVLVTMTDTITYSGIFEATRTRTWA